MKSALIRPLRNSLRSTENLNFLVKHAERLRKLGRIVIPVYKIQAKKYRLNQDSLRTGAGSGKKSSARFMLGLPLYSPQETGIKASLPFIFS
jgi:hypothetical protein